MLDNIETRFLHFVRAAKQFSGGTGDEIALAKQVRREIETLLSQTMPAGNHSVTFFSKTYPNGVYRYVVIAGEQRLSGKMVLVR